MFFNIGIFSGSSGPAGAYLSRMTDTDATIRSDITTLINGLVTDGIWDKLEYLGVIQNLEADSKLCLKRTAGAFTFNSYTYLANNYVKPNASSGYIGTGFDPEADATVMTEDSFAFSTYMGTVTVPVSSSNYAHGRWDGISSVSQLIGQYIESTPNSIGWALNSTPVFIASPTIGLWLSARNSTDEYIYAGSANHNLTQSRSGDFTWNPSASGDRSMFHGAYNLNGAAAVSMQDEVMEWHGGSYLTPTEVTNFRTRIETYLTARGAI